MCLLIKNQIILTTNITAYKICKCTGNPNTFYSLYYNEPYILGELKSIDKLNPVIEPLDDKFTVEGDAFHSFADIKTANIWMYQLGHYTDCKACHWTSFLPTLAIIECTIPKSTSFLYHGVFKDSFGGFSSYASQSIIPQKVVSICSF